MSIENKQNNKKVYLIEILPSWRTGKNYALVKTNQIEFKLYNIDLWKYQLIYPLLRVFNFINNNNFESDLRAILELVQNNHKKTNRTLNKLLERFD